MNYQTATPVAPPPYPPATGYGYTPVTPSPKRSRGGLIAGITGAILAAGLFGGVVGAVITSRNHQVASSTAPVATDTHAQDIQLCTSYATINSAMPNPQTSALEVLPGVNALRLALAGAPDASPEIRSAITDVTAVYDALIAKFGHVRTRGLADPPSYDQARAQESIDRVWALCQLDK